MTEIRNSSSIILRFEWDAAKAKSNYAKHGVSFAFAKRIFDDAFALDFMDRRYVYGEERYVKIGGIGDEVCSVTYTERQGKIRIISPRKASRHEKEIYYG